MNVGGSGAAPCWIYTTAAGDKKGPVTTNVLQQLVERNIVDTKSALVWKEGMEQWQLIAATEPFKESIEFQNKEWYFVDKVDGKQKGPVYSRMLMHKLEEGSIDVATLVFGHGLTVWTKLSEVADLKGALIKKQLAEQAREAQLAQLALQAQALNNGDNDNTMPEEARAIFEKMYKKKALDDIDDHDPDHSSKTNKNNKTNNTSNNNNKQYNSSNNSSGSSSSSSSSKQQPEVVEDMAGTKTFVADNGVSYFWDEDEQDWVEDDGEGVMAAAVAAAVEEEKQEETNAKKNNGKSNGKAKITGGQGKEKDKAAATTAKRKGAPGKEDGGGDGGDGEEGEADEEAEAEVGAEAGQKKKRKKSKKKKGPNNWVYISGLPADITADEIKNHFSKVGLIEISPFDQQPKIKIYKDELEPTTCKGDGSVCFNSADSAKLAIDILSGGYIRPSNCITVTKADFTAAVGSGGGGGGGGPKKPALSQAQVKVARAAMRQALTWNENDDIGVSNKSALKIVVLEGMFLPADFDNPAFQDELERDVAEEVETSCGQIEKLTLFSKHDKGIIIVKFATSYASQECVRVMNGRFFGGRKIKSYFWDGVTNYTMTTNYMKAAEQEEKEDEKRIDEFGDWLDNDQEELPEEFRLRTE